MHVQSLIGAVCMQAFAVSCALAQGRSLKSECGGFHCFDACCLDDLGNESCCYSSLYSEPWFWVLIVIGVIIVAVVLLCVCRALYRYHNAGQYTKLRLQQPDDYGSVTTTSSIQRPPLLGSDSSQLPSYAAAMGRPPPYSE